MLRRFFLAMCLCGQSAGTLAATPRMVQAGSIVNSWIQGPLRATNQLFDLGVNGRGFFALAASDGSYVFTRDGAFFLAPDGYLAHKSLGGHLVVTNCDASASAVSVVSLADRLTEPAAAVKTMRVNLDGSIEGVYVDGEVRKLGCLRLATFQNARKLRRVDGDGLVSTDASGEAYFGQPQTETFGSVFSSSREILEDEIYSQSLD